MGAYQQMGHQSENLLFEPELSTFAGVVLSPVNYSEDELLRLVDQIRYRRGYDIVFDPQLYVPRSMQQRLREWSYFPKDVDSADLASAEWWTDAVDHVVATALRVKPDAVCSPAQLPRSFTDEYFSHLVQVGNGLAEQVNGDKMTPLQSAVVGLSDLASTDRALAIASILSGTKCRHIYLVFVGPDTSPRRELTDADELKGAMKLIASLNSAGLLVTVAFSSSDAILWKAAGAAHCGTGKFFNLRRFTRSRFEEPPSRGGGAMAYWFEESLLAFIRESDLLRLRTRDLLSDASHRNPFGQAILTQLDKAPESAWIGLSWRAYLWWFADVERRVDEQSVDVNAMLRSAEERWATLEHSAPPLLMDEAFNNGNWVRPWRRALVEFPY